MEFVSCPTKAIRSDASAPSLLTACGEGAESAQPRKYLRRRFEERRGPLIDRPQKSAIEGHGNSGSLSFGGRSPLLDAQVGDFVSVVSAADQVGVALGQAG
jgi:hypothetical protein